MAKTQEDSVKNILKANTEDACHAGGLVALKGTTGTDTELIKFYKAFEDSRGGMALLLSSKGEEYSLEDSGLRSGVFSHFVIRGLKGEADTNKDKVVSVGSDNGNMSVQLKGRSAVAYDTIKAIL